MELNNIILKPRHTEKSYSIRKLQDPSCLVFVVDPRATKIQIKMAFKAIYNVTPEKINIINKKPKKLRITNKGVGYSKAMKLAYITLPKGMQIALTKDEIEEAAAANNKSDTKEKTAEPKKIETSKEVEKPKKEIKKSTTKKTTK